MIADGLLTGALAPYLGAGPGRGMGLLRALMGLCILLIALLGYSYPHIRRIEEELPDMIVDVAETSPAQIT
jgi:hypothetical protein